MEVNAYYASSFRFISTASIAPSLDAKLIAFYTILTVALSIMLSFKQSRCMLINNYTTYPLIKVKKCFRCLRRTKQQQQQSNNAENSPATNECSGTPQSYLSYSTSYLKLKSLKRLTLATLTAGSNIFTTMNSGFSSMKRKTTFLSYSRGNSLPCRHRKIKITTDSSICGSCKSLAKADYSSTMPNFNRINAAEGLPRSSSVPSGLYSKKIYNTRISLYRKLPLKSISRAWGEINELDLPVIFRKPCFYLYGWLYSCNFDEINVADLNDFKNLSEFFRRTLKPDARVIDTESCLVNPCDGRILNFGKSEKGYLEQVKGVNYSLKGFLGPQDWPTTKKNTKVQFTIEEGLPPNNLLEDDKFYEKNILYNPEENCLYHCIIYLAPGDYHRFHSCTDWNVHYRRHFPGELFSVNPSVARWLEGLFNFNERVVYYGDWKYGFMSYTAVGATNVGSIKVYMDDELATNKKELQKAGKHLDKSFLTAENQYKGVALKRGDDFGEFNLGSTIVLIFEAPKNFEFEIIPGEKIFLGTQLGSGTKSTYM